MKDKNMPDPANNIFQFPSPALHTKSQSYDILLHAPVATATYYGKEMVIEMANDKMVSYWGKDGSVVGKKLKDVFPEINYEPFLKLLDEVYVTGIPYHTNEQKGLIRVNESQETFWYNFTYQPLKNEENNVYGILHMAIDVTPQVAGKEKLALAEEKLLSAIEVANLGTWEYNLLTGEIILNDTLKGWRGIKKTGALTMNDLLNDDEESKLFRTRLNSALASGKTKFELDYTLTNPKTKERKYFHSRGKVIYNNELKPVLITGITQDVTIQRLTETDLETNVTVKTAELAGVNDDLRKLNANLEQFVYIASHDLQEPLRKINIFSEMLQKSNADINDEGKMYINKIKKASERMSLLINDLLEFSRISSKEKTFIPTDLNRLISDIKIDYELLIKQKNADIEIQPLPVIEAIPLQMHQLFYNLIGNALKFAKTDEQPVISVSCKMLNKEEIIGLKLNPKKSFCKIIVKDNGIGFDPQYAEKIFEIFQRLHGKHEYAGTGIGLALARKIADNHGGLITAESGANGGATFSVILPVTRQ